MMKAVILPVLLTAYLPALVTLHRFDHARATARAGRGVPTQGVALKAALKVALGFCLVLYVCAAAHWLTLPWTLWGMVVFACVGYSYWIFVCMTESGRRYMITELVAREPGLTAAEVVRRYDRYQILAFRLERLLHWGTVYQNGDRFVPRWTLMLLASRGVRAWAGVLGFGWAKNSEKRSSH